MLPVVKRNLIYLISCMDMFAVSLIIPVFAQHLQSLGLSNVNIGLLNSLYSSVQFFSSPIIGHLSDKFSSKRVLLATLLLCSLCYPIMGAVTSFMSLVVVRCVIGFIKHTQLLCKNYIEENIDENTHIEDFGKLSGFTSLGYIVGPIIGGYIIDRENGFHHMSCLAGFFFALNAVLVYFLSYTVRVEHKRTKTSLSFIRSFRSIPWSICWDLFVLKYLAVFAVFAFYINYSQSVTKRYEVSSVVIGYSYSLQGLIRSLTGFQIQRIDKLFPANLSILNKVRLTYVIVMLCFLSLYFSTTFYVYLLCLVPLNVCLCFIRIVNHEALVLRIKDCNKGIILGAFNNVTAVARFLLPLVSGYLVDRYSYDSVYAISIVSLLTGILVMSIRSRTEREKTE